ncbi:MAG: hypothetical protein Q7I97_09470 [Thermovirgaceae bacterium]|nr:hypothetical protein [Thermovirgaceae bacterium]
MKTGSIEIRGVSREDIESYFLESGWENISPGMWSFGGGRVEIGDFEEVSLGSIRLPSVTLVFRLRKSAFDEVLSTFRARFLRAGG